MQIKSVHLSNVQIFLGDCFIFAKVIPEKFSLTASQKFPITDILLSLKPKYDREIVLGLNFLIRDFDGFTRFKVL